MTAKAILAVFGQALSIIIPYLSKNLLRAFISRHAYDAFGAELRKRLRAESFMIRAHFENAQN